MELSNRKKRILQELILHSTVVTGTYLGNLLNVSARTVRSDIKSLNNVLKDIDVTIHSQPGVGYRLPKKHLPKVRQLLESGVEYKIPVLPEKRMDFIIASLMMHPKGVTIDTLSKALYVSPSTLKRDLQNSGVYLQTYQVSIKTKHHSYSLMGDEAHIRQLYFDYIYGSATRSEYTLMKPVRDRVFAILTDILNASDIRFSDNELTTIVLFLTIQQYRIEHGYHLQLQEKTLEQVDDLIDVYISKIASKLRLSKNEVTYFKRFIYEHFSATIPFDELSPKVGSILDAVCASFHHSHSDYLPYKLTKILNKQSHVKLHEFDLNDVSRMYPLAFEMAFTFIETLKKQNISYKHHTIKHIVLAFVNDVEQSNYKTEMSPVNVVVLTQSGTVSHRFIETKCKRHFNNFNIIQCLGTHEINQLERLEYDLIISTKSVDLPGQRLVVIDPLFKPYDVVKINTALKRLSHESKGHYELSNLFKETLFVTDLDYKSPFEIIKHLHGLMMQQGYTDDTFLEQVYARENISSTALGNLVAMPHAINQNTSESVVAVALLPKAIYWYKDKVQLIFLLNIGSASQEHVQNIFDAFYELIQSSKKINALLKTNQYFDFIKHISL